MILPGGGVVAGAGSVKQRAHWAMLMRRVLELGISWLDGLLVDLLGRDSSVLLMIMMMIGLWPGRHSNKLRIREKLFSLILFACSAEGSG
jgi:hypothetical protein